MEADTLIAQAGLTYLKSMFYDFGQTPTFGCERAGTGAQEPRIMLDHRFTFPELDFTDQRPRRTLVVRHGPRVRVVVVPASRNAPRPTAPRR
jgi:hypothetical protein